MNTKHYLAISGFVGGIIGSLLTTLLVSPVTAQRDKFEEIVCTSLRVVDADGNVGLMLRMDGDGGRVAAYGNDGKSMASLGIADHGGVVGVSGNDGQLKATLAMGEHGGQVQVKGKGQGAAIMGINKFDNGGVSTYDKNGNRQ